MGISFSTELLYLTIGIAVGTLLGINLTILFNRVFRRRGSREQALERHIKELEQRIRAKDTLIAKAIKASVRENQVR